MSIATRRLFMLSCRSHRDLTATRSASTTISDTPRFLKHNSTNPTLTDHTCILSCPQTRLTTLPNGLRIAIESNLSYKATVCVWIDTGSRFEAEENPSVANFLMNMVDRGTSKRSSSDLDEEFENMGGEYKSYISREQTSFIAKVIAGDMPKAIDILSDMLQNFTLEENMIVDVRNDVLNRMDKLLAYGRRIPLAEMLARVEVVDVATVKRLANKFIFDQDITIASVRLVELLLDYNWFRSRTSMLHY